MSWLGLWEPKGGTFRPAGLDRVSRSVVDINGLLPVGTMMLHAALTPSLTDQVLLDYQGKTPWAVSLRITVTPDGVVTLDQRQGDDTRRTQVATGHEGRARQVTLIYTWDAPARDGALSVEIADTGTHVVTRVDAPLVLTLRDAVRLMASPVHTRCAAGVDFAALADHVMPLGPLPSLSGKTLMAVPGGLLPLEQMRAGQLVTLADGSNAQVRWVGSVDLPARGRFAPQTLHAPYYGAIRDLGAGPDQRLQICGSDVEYLFAAPKVACEIGHLTDGVRPVQPPPGKLVRYWQVMLDRPAPLRIAGLDVEALDVGRILSVPGLRERSVLAGLPGELLPTSVMTDVPVLRGFETRTLCHLRAA